jgi:protein-disulfide isomerase
MDMLRRQWLITAAVVGLSLAMPAAQTQPDLEKRVAALEIMNRQMMQELQAIKAMLAGRGAPPPAGNALPADGPEIDLTMSIAGRPTKGNPAAKLVIVEFTDFQCPFCGRYARETYPQVMKEFVESGQALYVFRHFPIASLHPDAVNAARASECAFEQGKFWEVHDRLFNNQQRLQLAQLPTYAQGLGLNDARFAACMSTPASLGRINSDKQDGVRVGVTGTPGFLVGQVLGNGQVRLLRRFKGAADLARFRAVVASVAKAPRK